MKTLRENAIRKLAADLPFADIGVFSPALLHARQEIRDLCDPAVCPNYGTNWLCPPGAPELSVCENILHGYETAVCLLTKKEPIPPTFTKEDYEQAALAHNRNLYELSARFASCGYSSLILTTGSCEKCAVCAYPSPCRFPDRCRESFCGFGLNAEEVCSLFPCDYAFVPGKLIYVGLILIRKNP